ncbi:FAD-dependent dehydrogenase [Halobacteroides halobius DSM 5150]|uniref:FAD-dependent dehydrogenase n=1 Tax=Halobacteroides halobius (strain ATCC 35273 / DSM 5150 / MD-1) TaxID=748449 RepID=L0K5A9_HALHC|nr:FAD-dependent oxidoreductase [Halobacteroides halobius]AGB40457.1 FAD-dependent dehydrogenase [Halobacteroides halobius DSM 5150]
MKRITIVGAGVSGLFLAYTLLQKDRKLQIQIIDQGRPLKKRSCPLQEETKQCVSCNKCDQLSGLGGVMAKSEGKFNYTTDFGGKLATKLNTDTAFKLQNKVDQILYSLGTDKTTHYSTKNPKLIQEAKEHGLEVLTTTVRHLGTDLTYKITTNLYHRLKDRIDFRFNTEVTSIDKQNRFYLQTNQGIYKTDQLVLATGLTSNNLLGSFPEVTTFNTRVDLGIRVEMKQKQLASILQDNFETKLRYQGTDFTATTYCMNPGGQVVRKYHQGLVMADGQNYAEGTAATNKLNFTLFVPRYFPTSKQARDYAANIIGRINQNRERIIVQRWGDLKQKLATTEKRLVANSITPSLQAEPTNLYKEIPKLYLTAIRKFFQALEKLINQPIAANTLLYGLDAKFYQPEIKLDKNFQTQIENLYLIGDASGVSWSLAQAAASGIYLGNKLGC